MKKLLGILVLGLLFISAPSYADDIRDFQIEGMSIGDSLLNYMSEEDINQNKTYFYKSKKFASTTKQDSSFEIYETVQFHFIDNDKNYLIHTLDGHISYENNIEDCYKKKDEIVEEISSLFKNAKKRTVNGQKHDYDKSGMSKVSYVTFILESGGEIDVACTDWSDEMEFIDKLIVGLETKEFRSFMENEAYD